MNLWAIVPVKPLRRGKSRLAGVLTDEERTSINNTMLGNTLKALKETPEVDHLLVVSRDQSALALARDYEAKTLQEDGTSDNLNMALTRATIVAQIYSAQQILILPADLPLINPDNIQGLIKLACDPPVMVIAPDRRHEGTNALLINPPGLIEYQFGVDSFARHTLQAQHYKIRVEVLELQEFGLDLDLPEDLNLLRQLDGKQTGIPHF
jgi:2-phospho-L-lactate/phosphoenolpyruvate guanylyltransferase